MSKLKLLLIEDDAIVAEIVTAQMREFFDITVTDTGKGALAVFESGGCDLAILDLGLPDMSGLDVLKVMRQKYDPSRLPVIVVSSRNESDIMVQAFDAGANDYIEKPINMSVTVARIRSHANRITKPASNTDAATYVELIPGEKYPFVFLCVKLRLPTSFTDRVTEDRIMSIVRTYFDRINKNFALSHSRTVSRKEDTLLCAFPGKCETRVATLAIESIASAYLESIRHDSGNPMSVNIGIDREDIVYRADIENLYSDALNQAAHLAIHSEKSWSLKASTRFTEALSDRAKLFFKPDSAGIERYATPD